MQAGVHAPGVQILCSHAGQEIFEKNYGGMLDEAEAVDWGPWSKPYLHRGMGSLNPKP